VSDLSGIEAVKERGQEFAMVLDTIG